MVTLTTGPCLRFDSFEPSGAISNGRCANCGGLTPKRLEDQHVFEGVGEVILAADDVADAQVRVIGAGGHVIGRQSVAAQQGEVFDVGGGFRLLAVDQIVKRHRLARFARHSVAHYERLAGGGAAVAFFARELAHRGMESQWPSMWFFSSASTCERREIAIGQPFRQNLIRQFPVQVQAFGLAVEFVPAQIQPFNPSKMESSEVWVLRSTSVSSMRRIMTPRCAGRTAN